MKKMFKIILVCALSLAFVFGGCSKPKSESGVEPQSESTAAATEQNKSANVPEPDELDMMISIFDGINIALYHGNKNFSGEYSSKNKDAFDEVLRHVINHNWGELDCIENQKSISANDMNALASACFADATCFLETPADTKYFAFNGKEYVLKENSDRGELFFPVIKKTEKTADGKIKTTVEYLSDGDKYYKKTIAFYLVPNENDKTGKFPWAVESFEVTMEDDELYNKLPFKEMSDSIKAGSGGKPYYQPIVVSYEDTGEGTVYVTAWMYRYDESKPIYKDGDFVISYSGDDNDGLCKFTLTENGGKYVVKNSEII